MSDAEGVRPTGPTSADRPTSADPPPPADPSSSGVASSPGVASEATDARAVPVDAAHAVPGAPGAPGTPPLAGAAPRGMAAVLGEEFSVVDAVGGVRGLIESVAPGVVFIAVYVATRSLTPALVASVGVMVAAVVVRLVQRTPVTQALAGVVGVGVGVIWAWRTGEAQDFFALGLLTNAAYGVACLVSILVGWPLVGIVVGLLRGGGTAWRADRVARARATWATWVWVAMFGLRLAVQLPLYLGASVGWLGTARLVMGVPLWALTLWITWLLVRTPGSSPAPTRPPAAP